MEIVHAQNLLPQMKRYLPWLKEADSQALKYACRQINTAYDRFFKKRGGYPKFHNKHGRQSYTTTNNCVSSQPSLNQEPQSNGTGHFQPES